MPDTPTLSTAAFEHPALDYAALRREGIRHLESLAGQLWTDFNTHDPGITILEQLCYAITDLGYRAAFDVPDLLATSGGDPYRSLYSAATILTSHPVTLLDLRKLILDVDGVKNAWIEQVVEPRPALHYREDKRELGFSPDPPYTTPVLRNGSLRVLIERSDLVDRTDVDVQRDVARRLLACRPLCSDFEDIQVLAAQPIQVFADIEIGPVDDAEGVLIAIYQALSQHVSPSIPFQTLGEMLAAGKRSDEIFDGPVLDHGFLDSAALDALRRKDAIHTSDLIREIMAVPGVRAVRSIAVSANDARREPWSLALDPSRTPRLDLQGSSIVLRKGRLTARLDAPRILDAVVEQLRRAASRDRLAPGDRDFLPPAGRDRLVARYRSVQHQFPAIYGIGAAGLPDSAGDRRTAQAKQLKAYLLFFDQLLATYFAQLAGAGSLFSFFEPAPRTYFTQAVDDDGLALSDVRTFDAATHGRHLRDITEDAGDDGTLSSRKHRFLNHLMARFAEQFTDYSLVLLGAGARGRSAGDRLVPDKQAFLQRYPQISSARGTGLDVLAPGDDGVSGLQERIERKLGLSAADGERLILIEHVLLAPAAEDNVPPGELEYRQVPLLSASGFRDPYSLQLSVVLPGGRGRLRQNPGQVNELRLLVEHTVRDETPAHITPFVHWLDETRWPELAAAYDDWRDAYRDHRATRLGLAPIADPRQFRARDARDRLIDLLGFATTYPLRDLPVRDDRLTVPFGQPARIPIESSQRGVIYELRGDGDAALARAEGTGGTIFLTTPAMREDTTFHILARKLAPVREVYLQQHAVVKIGLDVTLRTRIVDADLLDPSSEHPSDEAPRIVDWGTRVSVQIDHSQEGVDYHLLQIIGGQERRLSADVRGNLGDIVLSSDPADDDLELRIRATKLFDPSEHREAQTALLDAVLPLLVGARSDLAIAPEPASVVELGAGATVRIDGTQTTAAYSLYLRAIADRDFAFGDPDPDLLYADVDGARVHVRPPPRRPTWDDLDGLALAGPPAPGNGGTLRLPLPALGRDSLIFVRAWKQHRHGATTTPSSVRLAQAALILVRPDPAPALVLGVVMDGARTDGTLQLTGGEPGVFYEVRRDPQGPRLGLPAYFHKTDEHDPASNKGLGADPDDGLRLEVDLAISRGLERRATTRDELAATRPLPPVIATGPLDAGTTLYLRAIKAQTRAALPLPRTAQIAPLPRIAAEPAVVATGGTATLVVHASAAGDRYQLLQDGRPVGSPHDGDGSDLALPTGPLARTTRFQVLVTRPAEPGLPVQRTVEITVAVGLHL